MASPDLISRTTAAGALLLTLLCLGFWTPQRFTPVLSEPYHALRLTVSKPQATPAARPNSPILSPADNSAPAAAPAPSVATQAKTDVKVNVPQIKLKPKAKPEQKLRPRATAQHPPKPPATPQAQAVTKPQQRTKPSSTGGTVTPKPAPSAAQPSSMQQAEAQQQARAFISSEIVAFFKESTVYPRQALRRKIQGTVLLEFTVRQGVIISCVIAKSSGAPLLDRAALKLGQELIGFDSKQHVFDLKLQVPLRYALR